MNALLRSAGNATKPSRRTCWQCNNARSVRLDACAMPQSVSIHPPGRPAARGACFARPCRACPCDVTACMADARTGTAARRRRGGARRAWPGRTPPACARSPLASHAPHVRRACTGTTPRRASGRMTTAARDVARARLRLGVPPSDRRRRRLMHDLWQSFHFFFPMDILQVCAAVAPDSPVRCAPILRMGHGYLGPMSGSFQVPYAFLHFVLG